MELMDAPKPAEAGTRFPVPDGGLRPLPTSFWTSRQVLDAVAVSPGAVIAAARRAYGLRQEELGLMAGFSQSTISRLESGGNLAYDMRVLRALQRLLGVPAALLGLADPPSRTPAGDDQQRREEPERGLGTWPALEGLVPKKAKIGPELISQLLVARQVVNDAHDWRSAEALKPAARQLYEVTDALRRSASGRSRNDLLAVAATYAEFYGWLHEETGDPRMAEYWTARSLSQAQAADDRNMVAYAYTRLSALAETEGDEDRVIGLARAALREDGIRPRVRAFALHQLARGLAARGEEMACLTVMDEAVDLAAGAERTDQPTGDGEYVVGNWINPHQMIAERAGRLLDLRRVPEALAEYERMHGEWGRVCPWLQGVHTAKYALAHALRGNLDEAAVIALDTIPFARHTGSRAVVKELRRLRRWSAATPMLELNKALNALC